VKEYQQKQLLERANREGATVGADIPDRITVQGEEVNLREFVFEIKRRDTVPPGERDRVETAKKNLRRERLQRLQRIERNEVTYEEGEDLVESIIGIDRALNALEQLRPPDIEREAQAQQAADQKRWMKFLRQALGREDANKPGRR
jgi:predicted Zn-dependent peptidase